MKIKKIPVDEKELEIYCKKMGWNVNDIDKSKGYVLFKDKDYAFYDMKDLFKLSRVLNKFFSDLNKINEIESLSKSMNSKIKNNE